MKKRLLFLFLSFYFLSFTVARAELVVIDGLIYDSTYNLIWVDHPFSAKNWSDASTYAADLVIDSDDSWRLPTRAELGYITSSINTPRISNLFNLGPVKNWSVWTSESFTDSHYVSPLSARAYLFSFMDARSYSDTRNAHHAFLVNATLDYLFLLDSDGLYLRDSSSIRLVGAQ